jgi:hypothetical protein
VWLWGTHPIPKWNNPEILLWVWRHCLLTPHSAVTVTVAAIVTLAFDFAKPSPSRCPAAVLPSLLLAKAAISSDANLVDFCLYPPQSLSPSLLLLPPPEQWMQ